MSIGKKIKSRRLKLNKTLEDIADKCNVSKSTIQRWESGEIKNVRHDKIANLAIALEVTPSYLMGWCEEDKKDLDEEIKKAKQLVNLLREAKEIVDSLYSDNEKPKCVVHIGKTELKPNCD